MQPSFNERSVISNAVPIIGQPPNNTQGNQAGSNQSQVIGDLGTNSHAISSPAKATLVGTTTASASNQIPGDLPYNSYGVATNPSASGASQTTTNSTHEVLAPPPAQTAASTWSKFARQAGPSQAIESTKTLDSFQQFKKQAKEKQDKEKFIEIQEQKRREREREQLEREQQEKERLTQDQEGEIAVNSLARSEQSPVLSPASDSQSPASGAGTSGSSSGVSNMLKREQERRKREALASQNQMDLSRQSEIMSKFEDRV